MAQRQNIPLISFNGGEIGDLAISRIDIENYASRSTTLENWLATVQGPMHRAPGSYYLFEFDDAEGAAPVVRQFSFNRQVGETFTLVMGEQDIKWFTPDGRVVLPGGTATLGNWSTPAALPPLPPEASQPPPLPPPPTVPSPPPPDPTDLPDGGVVIRDPNDPDQNQSVLP